MEMPKPTAGHKKLALLAGNWSGEEQMHPSPWDPKGGIATATNANRVACDGFHVVGDYEQKRGGVVTFRGHAVFSYDDKTQEVSLHWFDSMGAGAEHFRGKFQDQTLSVSARSAMGEHRLTYDFSQKGTLRCRMESSQDGKQWKPLFDGVYHPVG